MRHNRFVIVGVPIMLLLVFGMWLTLLFKLNASSNEKEALKERVGELVEENVDLKKEIDTAREDVEDLFIAKYENEEELEQLSLKVKEKDERIEELELKNNSISKENEALTHVSKSKKSDENAGKNKSREQSKATYTMNTSYYSIYCSGCTGRTASGYKLSHNQTTVDGYRVIAADTSIIPLNSIIRITNPDGSSYEGIVLDRGGAIKGHRIDVLTTSTKEAYKLGRHSTKVEVIKYGDNKYRKVN